jgi:hypothetical protein
MEQWTSRSKEQQSALFRATRKESWVKRKQKGGSLQDPQNGKSDQGEVCILLFCSVGWISMSPPTQWSRVILVNLIVQLVIKFSALYGICRFITVFTRACHRSLSFDGWIHFTPSNPISVRYILIL